MAGPVVMVVRETTSLADSVQLLLETVGFRVVAMDRVAEAVARLAALGEEPIRAVVLASNQPRSDKLRIFPEAFPPGARNLPLVVVGDRSAHERHGWPANVHFVRLPIETRRFLELLDSIMHGSRPVPTTLQAAR